MTTNYKVKTFFLNWGAEKYSQLCSYISKVLLSISKWANIHRLALTALVLKKTQFIVRK